MRINLCLFNRSIGGNYESKSIATSVRSAYCNHLRTCWDRNSARQYGRKEQRLSKLRSQNRNNPARNDPGDHSSFGPQWFDRDSRDGEDGGGSSRRASWPNCISRETRLVA